MPSTRMETRVCRCWTLLLFVLMRYHENGLVLVLDRLCIDRFDDRTEEEVGDLRHDESQQV